MFVAIALLWTVVIPVGILLAASSGARRRERTMMLLAQLADRHTPAASMHRVRLIEHSRSRRGSTCSVTRTAARER
jgi:hypothetical protein